MAFSLLRTWDGTQRGSRYQLRIDLTDGTRIVNTYGGWASAPTQAQIDAAVANAIAQAEYDALPPSQTYRVTSEDAVTVDIVDRPSTTAALTPIDVRVTLTTGERNAWTTVKPILKTYLRKIFRAYRAATPAQREQLLMHNAILAAVIDMVGDE